MNALNLYCGIGGNRKLWPKSVKVTAVELDPIIAAIYKKLFPLDEVIVADAHLYLLKNFQRFDFIWSSPPCQSHSQMNYYLKEKRYPDMSLYEEAIFLRTFCKKPWVVENVRGYYAPLLKPSLEISRHLFWSNFAVSPCSEIHWPQFGSNTRERETMLRKLVWMGYKLQYSDFKGMSRPRQIVDNCVHPAYGLHLLRASKAI